MLYYAFLSIFAFAFVLANTLGGKIVPFPFIPNLFLTTGTLIYPITFVISDLVTEVWGEKKAKMMILMSFCLSIFVFINLYTCSFDFRISGILILSSLTAFIAGQLLDVRLFTLIKKWTNGRHLWLRNQLSTYISQFFDTVIVNCMLLIWGLHLSHKEAACVLLGNLLYKMIFTVGTIPLLYFSVKKVRAYEV